MNCLELFAGAGGAALGLRQAGFKSVCLVERDKQACKTLRAAGHSPVLNADVRNIPAIRKVVGATPVQVIWSSFPCQAWSLAGSRKGAADERNGWPDPRLHRRVQAAVASRRECSRPHNAQA